MAAEGLSMRKIREIVRLFLLMHLTGRAIARSVNASPSTVGDYIGRIKVAGLTWPLPSELDSDEALSRLLFRDHAPAPKNSRPLPDFAWVHRELKRPHVTKMLLWDEYRGEHPDGLGYSQFCEHYARFARKLNVTMRQEHKAGDKMFVDFSGDGFEIYDPETGEVQKAVLFVAVLGASNYTYAEPVLREDLPTWIACHVHAFEFFGGVTALVVPDNLKAGVKRPDFYEPDLNPTYADLSKHYGCAVIPARPRKPRDKAKVEQGVLLAERWIIASLRNQRFTSLVDLREAVRGRLERLNQRKMRKLDRSRQEMFEEVERAALRPLPEAAYELASFKTATANIDYHVEFDRHYYSVHYTLAQETVEVRATALTVEILFKGERVASHVRSAQAFGFTTNPEHRPRSHRAYAEWTPSRMIDWAGSIGPDTAKMVEAVLNHRPHPEQGFRTCLGIIRLSKKYEAARLEAACRRALSRGALSYRSVAGILRAGLDREEPEAEALPLGPHGNIRGPSYYH